MRPRRYSVETLNTQQSNIYMKLPAITTVDRSKVGLLNSMIMLNSAKLHRTPQWIWRQIGMGPKHNIVAFQTEILCTGPTVNWPFAPWKGRSYFWSICRCLTKPGDIDHHTRVKVYHQILKKYPGGLATRCLFCPWRWEWWWCEALWHSLIRMNRVDIPLLEEDHAGPGKNSKGIDFTDRTMHRNFGPLKMNYCLN